MIDDVKPANKPPSGSDNQTKTDSKQYIKLDLPIKEYNEDEDEDTKSDFDINDLAVDAEAKTQGQEKTNTTKMLEAKNKRRGIHLNFKLTRKEWISSAVVVIVCGIIVALVINHT